MSSLRSEDNKIIHSINKGKPSPTHQTLLPDSARDPDTSRDGGRCRSSALSGSLERTSLFAFSVRKVKAGMTVEASIVLPLFLFFFLNLCSAIEMIRLHGNLQLALWQTGSKMAVYGYALDSGELPENNDGWWRELAGVAVSATYVKSQVINSAGADYLNGSPLANGAGGLQLWESDIFGSDDLIDIIVTYSVSPWSSLIGFRPFRMANRYCAHIWNGYEVSGPGQAEEVTRIVYVTENGAVYHGSMECTHLQLSVQEVPSLVIEDLRNQGGGKYYPCSRCAGTGPPSTLYITREGDRYHYSRGCSGLKRTVSSMTIEQAQEAGLRPCSRCGG